VTRAGARDAAALARILKVECAKLETAVDPQDDGSLLFRAG
jgi:hypothetical protein